MKESGIKEAIELELQSLAELGISGARATLLNFKSGKFDNDLAEAISMSITDTVDMLIQLNDIRSC